MTADQRWALECAVAYNLSRATTMFEARDYETSAICSRVAGALSMKLHNAATNAIVEGIAPVVLGQGDYRRPWPNLLKEG